MQILRMYGEPPKELVQKLNEIVTSPMLVNFCCTNLPVPGKEKQELLTIDNERDRAYNAPRIL